MKINENNNLDQDKAGPSSQVNFFANPNYRRPSKRALPMDIRVHNIGHVKVEEKKLFQHE